MTKPLATAVGALLMVARTISGVIVIVVVAGLTWREYAQSLVRAARLDGGRISEGDAGVVLAIVLAVYALSLLLYLVLALFVYHGHNWARILAMALATISIILAFADYVHNGVQITLRTTLVSLALDILILLALSGSPARLYARRPRPGKAGRRRGPGETEAQPEPATLADRPG